MTLSPELAALRDEAMVTSCEGWAIRHRWALAPGIDRAGPCPVCGGTDRFAIHTKKNTFNCRQCGIAGGGVIDLVMKTENVDFIRACEIITGRKSADKVDDRRMAELRQKADRDEQKRRAEIEQYKARARQDGHDIWVSGWAPAPDGPVAAYLKIRALDFSDHPAIKRFEQLRLREYDYLPYADEVTGDRGRRSWQILHRGPAMLAEFLLPARMVRPDDPLGRFGGVHRTWIDLDQPKGRLVLPPNEAGKPRATKKMRGLKQGGALALYTPPKPRRIVMGEGIETTLTPLCHAYEPDTAYWAAGDIANMGGKAARGSDGRRVEDQPDMDDLANFLPPDWCEELVYLGEDGGSPRNRAICLRGLRRALRLRQAARDAGRDLPPLGIFYVSPGDSVEDLNDIAMLETAAP